METLSPTATVAYTYGDEDWGDLLTGYAGQTITSDAIGNMLSDGTRTYTWQHGRELASMSSGSVTWNFTYNADDLRTRRTDGTTTYDYTYNGSTLTQMRVGSDVLHFVYDASGMPMTVTYNGTTYYYVTNLQGDVIAILDTEGTAVVTYTYDAWGKILTTGGEMADTLGTVNPLRYRGYVYDQETGLYYLQSRYYDPEMGRFINADGLVSNGSGLLGGNMFAYCNNNPICCADSSGFYKVEVVPSTSGIQISAEAEITKKLGTVTVVVALDVDIPNLDPLSLGSTEIEVSTEGIEISFPDGKTIGASFDLINQDVKVDSVTQSWLPNASVGFDTTFTKKGFAAEIVFPSPAMIEGTISVTFAPNNNPVETAVNTISSKVAAGSLNNWSGSAMGSNLSFSGMCGGGSGIRMINTTTMFM